jgi:hypothetical protein
VKKRAFPLCGQMTCDTGHPEMLAGRPGNTDGNRRRHHPDRRPMTPFATVQILSGLGTMAFRTSQRSLTGLIMVLAPLVTIQTPDLLPVGMQGVVLTPDPPGPAGIFLLMTGDAGVLVEMKIDVRGKGLGPFPRPPPDPPYLLGQGRPVTVLAAQPVMFPAPPALIGGLHQMARTAKRGIGQGDVINAPSRRGPQE